MEDGQFQCRTDRGRNVFTRKRRIKLHTYQLPQAHAVLYSAVAAYECSPRGLKLKTDPRAFAGGGKRSAGQSPSEHPTKVYPLSSPPVLRCPCITWLAVGLNWLFLVYRLFLAYVKCIRCPQHRHGQNTLEMLMLPV